jgi:N-acetylglucosaminyldiphosphoundecaprenol N-acetyl-beta-D-mannosaminyltransferase
MPAQEKWIFENWEDLDIKVALPVGALFDYLSGEVYRAPNWMTDNGLEWFGRLLFEPGRLWRRYLIGNPLFIWRVFVHHVLKLPLPKGSSGN